MQHMCTICLIYKTQEYLSGSKMKLKLNTIYSTFCQDSRFHITQYVICHVACVPKPLKNSQLCLRRWEENRASTVSQQPRGKCASTRKWPVSRIRMQNRFLGLARSRSSVTLVGVVSVSCCGCKPDFSQSVEERLRGANGE